jgi:hypothetical protein
MLIDMNDIQLHTLAPDAGFSGRDGGGRVCGGYRDNSAFIRIHSARTLRTAPVTGGEQSRGPCLAPTQNALSNIRISDIAMLLAIAHL